MDQPPYFLPPHVWQYRMPNGGSKQVRWNLWLSVFLGFVPALVFCIQGRELAVPGARLAHSKNLKFQVLRSLIGVLILFPNAVVALVAAVCSVVLTVFSVINAVRVPRQVAAKRRPEFVLERFTAPD
ncbi:MAG: hypothetical protein ACTIJJ_08420 [Galactobacter sp.]